MGYTIRRWFSISEMQFDDSSKVKTSEEAIKESLRLAGICRSLINEDIKNRIIELKDGEVVRIKKPSLKFTMIIRKTKRYEWSD